MALYQSHNSGHTALEAEGVATAPKLQSVLIVAKNTPVQESLRALYSGNDSYCIIGNGESLVSNEEFNSLSGRVNSNTRFDIYGAGWISTKNPTLHRHMLDLFQDNLYPLPVTVDVIERINRLVSGPVEVHIWSCYSSADASDLVTRLPLGSIIVTHDSHNTAIINDFAQREGFSAYFPHFKLLDPNLEVQKRIEGTIEFALSAGKVARESHVVGNDLDLNLVLKTLHLGSSTGLSVAIHYTTKEGRSMDYHFDLPTELSDVTIRGFFSNIKSVIHNAVSSKVDGIILPLELDPSHIQECITSATDNVVNLPVVAMAASAEASGAQTDEVSQEDSAPKFTSVLLRGPNTELSTKIIEAYQKDGAIIIGDGKFVITKEQFVSSLKGRVDSSTRFDIYAHGSITHLGGKNVHILDLFEGLPFSTTSYALKNITELMGQKPVEVHLWSCYGASSIQDAQYLSKGSIFIAHASNDMETIYDVSMDGIYSSIAFRNSAEILPDVLDYNMVIRTAHFGAASGLSIAVRGDNVRSCEFIAPLSSLIITKENIATFFSEVRTTIYQAIKDIAVKGVVIPEADPQFEFTLEEIATFYKNTLFWHALMSTTIDIKDIAHAVKDDVNVQKVIFDQFSFHIADEIHKQKLCEFLIALQKENVEIAQLFIEPTINSLGSTMISDEHFTQLVEVSERINMRAHTLVNHAIVQKEQKDAADALALEQFQQKVAADSLALEQLQQKIAADALALQQLQQKIAAIAEQLEAHQAEGVADLDLDESAALGSVTDQEGDQG